MLLLRLFSVVLLVGGFVVGAWGAAQMDRAQLVVALVLAIVALVLLQWAEYAEQQGMVSKVRRTQYVSLLNTLAAVSLCACLILGPWAAYTVVVNGNDTLFVVWTIVIAVAVVLMQAAESLVRTIDTEERSHRSLQGTEFNPWQ